MKSGERGGGDENYYDAHTYTLNQIWIIKKHNKLYKHNIMPHVK